MKQALRLTTLALAMFGTLAITGAAHAQDGPPLRPIEFMRQGLAACGSDIARYCGRTVPGQGRIAQCLSDEYESLTPACQDFVDRSFDLRNVIFACAADAKRYCPDVTPGGGRVAACLFAQRDLVSQACADAVSSVLEEPRRGKLR